jgi:tetratricopeptide (TPR) repeat protein
VLALAVRALYLWQISSAPFFGLRLGDAGSYHDWAHTIADGEWIGSGVFYQAPLYPYFLAVIYRVLNDGVLTVRMVQAVLGAASCAMLSFAGVRWFGRWGVLAGALLAVYPSAVFLDGSLEKSALVTFFTTALLAAMAARQWALAGVALGLLALTRENALVLAIPIVVWAWKERRHVVFAGACIAVLLPVAIRNRVAGGEFHLTTAQFGPNFYIGNHPGAKGTYEALVAGHGSAADEREDATRIAQQALGRTLRAGEVSSYWTGRALDYIRSQPAEWLALMARKAALALNRSEVTDTESQSVYAEWSWLLKAPLDFGVLLALAAAAAVFAGARVRLLLTMAAVYLASVALFYVFGRYRFPLVPFLMLIVAAGASHLDKRRMAAACLAAAAALALSWLPLDDANAARAITYHSIGAALAKEPDHAFEALGFYQSAIAADARYPAAHAGLATLLAEMSRRDEAVPHFQNALAHWPDFAEARYNLGLTLDALGRSEEAARELEHALRLRPGDPDIQFALARTLLALHRPKESAVLYQQGLLAQPKHVAALVGWGVALAQAGYADEALRKFQTALVIDPRNAAAHNSMGSALASLGRGEEAIRHFELALKADPGSESARRNLEQAQQMVRRR